MSSKTYPHVKVLLSSYNGSKYIENQINSILHQKDVEVDILIRDDGSSDNTVDLVKQINDERIKIICGENLGATNSFLFLIAVAQDAEYYAFSDQDDIWDSDKLIKAINLLSKHSYIPAIYSSNTRCVNSKLELLCIENKKPETNLGSALIKNYVTGCTVVMNAKLLELLKYKTDVTIPYHDWWANLVCLSNGGISVYDHEAHIDYRQHEGNVVGAESTFIGKWKIRLKRFLQNKYNRDIMAKELLKIYNKSISQENRKILTLFTEGKQHKMRLIMNNEISTCNGITDFLFWICVIFQKL